LNSFQKAEQTYPTSVTTRFQKELRNTLKECKMLIGMDNKGKFINLNLEPPSLRGLIKVHKTNTPICPIVHFKKAPSYRLAKMFTGILKSYIPLSNIYNVQNSVQLMRDLSDIPFVPGLKLASLDISDMYTSIPTEDVINIISNLYII